MGFFCWWFPTYFLHFFTTKIPAEKLRAVGWLTTNELKVHIDTLAEKAVDSFKLKTEEDRQTVKIAWRPVVSFMFKKPNDP